jgi:hypothetical protein
MNEKRKAKAEKDEKTEKLKKPKKFLLEWKKNK